MRFLTFIFLLISQISLSQDRSQWSRASGSSFQMPNMLVKGKLIDTDTNDGLSYANKK